MTNSDKCTYIADGKPQTVYPSLVSYTFFIRRSDIGKQTDLRFHPAPCETQAFFRQDGTKLEEAAVMAGFPVDVPFFVARADLDDNGVEFTLIECVLREVDAEANEYRLMTDEIAENIDPFSEKIQNMDHWRNMAAIAIEVAEEYNRRFD